ncbi:hypothetical protein [Blastopirellula marina]|uniref:Uncharacterized protein n=1 Tax=Blastopirellula marina TaxID=124 RepID=A0A2S8FI14_9BACT|nr:hypothetical protein [Blastopirellula marina]PQO31783.1 hypothetical protein C5Y98_20460 [Blastopirellula marina]PTL43090.1 hypothetical protein C5Y97_20470 [Blastopirellula marina]
MKDDFFFDETCDDHLREGEQMVWRGSARGIVPRNYWVASGSFAATGVLLGLASNAFFPSHNVSQTAWGLAMLAMAFFALFQAVMPYVRMLAILRRARYVITTQRALILDGVVELPNGSIACDPVPVRSISSEQLFRRTDPSPQGTILLGHDDVIIKWQRYPCQYGFYACSEPEGAEMEIRRLLGELPPVIDHAEPVL